MSARVVAEVRTDGAVVACKTARDEADEERLRHEAAVLESARHPGVVELVACEDEGEGLTLVTGFVGTHSLETVGPMPVERAAGIVAVLAETVADLHDVGIVHGRIDPTHVLIGPAGRPVLCGFAGGGRIGTTPPPGSTAAPGFCDPAATDAATLAPSLDVFGLGALLRVLVGDDGTDAEPIPDQRFSVARLRPRWTGYQRRALLTLADHCTDDIPTRRPPARRVAAEIAGAVPGATIAASGSLRPEAHDRDPFALLRDTAADPAPERGRKRAMVAGVAAMVVGAALLWSTLRSTGSAASEPVLVSPSTNAAAQTATTLADATRGCAAATALGPDLDGDGCGDAVVVHDDRSVDVGDHHYTVGVEGDRVVAGDWYCTGVATLAVLRPSTGAVFVFRSWAAPDGDVSIEPTTVVGDAVAIAAAPGPDGCATLLVTRADGTTQEVRL